MKKIVATLALLSIAAILPPKPPARHKAVHGPSKGDGAAALIAKARPKPTVVTPNYYRMLVWDWHESPGNYWSNVVFLIRTSSDLKHWSGSDWTPTNQWLFYLNLENTSMFFTVSASNTSTHLVSEYSK